MFFSFQRFAGILCFFFFYFCFFFPLVLFFLTPLSFCVALYHGAGLGPCSLDPFCLLASWLTPPTPYPPTRSDAASRGTAQKQGLQKALKPGEPELLLPQFRTGRVGGRGWHVFSPLCASKWMRIDVYVWSSEVSLCPLPPLSTGLTVRLSAREPASYLRLRQCRGKSSAKPFSSDMVPWVLAEGFGVPYSWERSGEHKQGWREGERERGRWRSLDRRFLIARYSHSVNLR